MTQNKQKLHFLRFDIPSYTVEGIKIRNKTTLHYKDETTFFNFEKSKAVKSTIKKLKMEKSIIELK